MTRMLATLAVVTAAIASPAAAVTIDLGTTFDTGGGGYASSTQSFALAAGFTNASLNITSVTADDAAVVILNGTTLFGVGIFGPGAGNFYYTANGASQPFTFAANGSGGTFTSPFVAGINTLQVILNNNNSGINGGNGPLTGGPNGVTLVGNVTYDAASSGAVPEPATWAMLVLGFGLVGASVRRRRLRSAVA